MKGILKETLKKLDNITENMEVGLIEELTENEENENVSEELIEKIDLRSLKWRSAEFMESDTSWKVNYAAGKN